MKKGKVYVDKKEYLTYEGDVFYSLDGVRLFTLEKQTIEKANPNKNTLNTVSSDVQDYTNTDSNGSDPQRRGNRYSKPKKVFFVIVAFNRFKLEYETRMRKSKITKEFGFAASDILMVDDTQFTFDKNPSSGIPTPRYSGPLTNAGRNDTMMMTMAKWMKKSVLNISDTTDVRSIDKRNWWRR